MTRLKCPCALSSIDSLGVVSGRQCAFPTVEFLITMPGSQDVANSYVALSEEDVRALFNWLGVWLHGGNRDSGPPADTD